jgi:membrane protein required for colicin V production
MENLSILDMVILSILAFFGIKGLLKGFVKEIFSIVGILIGYFFASKYALIVGAHLKQYITSIPNEYIYHVGYIVFFAGVILLSGLISSIINKVLTGITLGLFPLADKALGGVFGITKATLVISIVLSLFNSFEFSSLLIKEQSKSSQVLPMVVEYNKKLLNTFPALKEVHTSVFNKDNLDKIGNSIETPSVESIIKSQMKNINIENLIK